MGTKFQLSMTVTRNRSPLSYLLTMQVTTQEDVLPGEAALLTERSQKPSSSTLKFSGVTGLTPDVLLDHLMTPIGNLIKEAQDTLKDNPPNA